MRARLFAAAGAAILAGCASILGAPDLTYDPSAAPGSDGGGADGSSSGADGSSGGADSGVDGGPCGADLLTDGKNCGRCGRDCQGATCTAGVCDAVTLAQGLDQPTGIALDATFVYFVTAGDGSVSRVPKTGTTVEPLVQGATSPIGVAVDGTSLYWACFAGGAGGIFRCDVATGCSGTQKQISQTGYDRFVAVSNGVVYFTTESDVRRMKPDGGFEAPIASATQPYALAVDGTHVYFTSGQTQLQRVQIDGGDQTDVGPLTSATNLSFVAVDAERFYWAFVDQTSGKGQVLSGQKAAPSTRVSYGTNYEDSFGVAADDTYAYWSNGGTFTGSTPNGDGQLLACHKTGCTAGEPLVVADKLSGAGQVVTDAVAIYWLEYGGGASGAGRVRKVAKP